MKLKKGDKVKVLAGKDKGKSGKILQVYKDKDKVSVEGVNLRYKNMRPRRQGEKGQRIQFPAPLSVSNVMLVCPKCNKAIRVSYKIMDNKKKIRSCSKCKELIS